MPARQRGRGPGRAANGKVAGNETLGEEAKHSSSSPHWREARRATGVLGWVGDAVFRLNPHLTPVIDASSKYASSWYLSPEQHFLETLAASAYVLWQTGPLLRGQLEGWEWREGGGGGGSGGGGWDGGWQGPRDWVDHAVTLVTVLNFCALVYFKARRKRLIFMLQPCNLTATLFVLCCVWPSAGAWWTGALFNFALYTMWGTWLGIVAADLRDYEDALEIRHFWLNHSLLLLLPFYFLARGRFPVFADQSYALHALFSGYHYLVLAPTSLISGVQLQYMCHPPKQLKFAGKAYRPLMMLACLGFTLMARSIVTEKFLDVLA